MPTAAEKLNVALIELTLELNDMALAAALAADELALFAFLVCRDGTQAVKEILEKALGDTPRDA